MGIDPFFTWFVPPVLGLFTVYHLLSFGTNLCYRQFDVSQHESLREEFWLQHVTPSVDIFLPICGEKISILEHTWRHVAQLAYDNKRVYVLDDSAQHSDKHRAMAERYGFIYLERPNKGEMKKAGNLKYAFQRTDGEFIVIFDADFAPHPDFLRETIPYMSNPRIGIVQTPQYFDIAKDAYRRSPLAYAAAYQEEFFYRIIQVAKDRFDAAICCGSNAVYRRTALQAIGGPRQVTASEDSRTGFALLSKGWVTRYIPLIVAVGICPDNVYAYYHQQHRWCRGRSELVLSKEFRRAPVSLLKKLLNTTGFLAFLLRPLELALTLQLFWMLFL
jgi:cellulose synthase/poly-beta-1,6-N-acetylglucosamine synthase-like glycosyltransferase